MEIGDFDEDFDDSKEENKNEEEMMFDSRHGDYFPDYILEHPTWGTVVRPDIEHLYIFIMMCEYRY